MSGDLSPIRRLGQTIENLIQHRKVDVEQPTLDVLSIIQNYLTSYDESWSEEQAKYHLDALAHQLELKLSSAPVTSVDAQQSINNAFDRLTTSMEHCANISLGELNELTLAIDDLRQSVNQALSKVFVQLSTLHSKVDILQSRVSILEAQCGTVKKMNFIADLFTPLVSAINERLVASNIAINAFYGQTNLEKMKIYLFCGDGCADKNESIVAMSGIVRQVSDQFKIEPNVAIDYIVKNKQRNQDAHFNKKIKQYIAANPSSHVNLPRFLASEPDLEREFLYSEIKSLEGLFKEVVKDCSFFMINRNRH